MAIVLLLYELLGEDPFRHYRSEIFPFILGLHRRAGLEASWKVAGARFGSVESERFFVELDEEARGHLASTIAKRGITRIIFNESLGAGIAGFLRESFPELGFSSIGDLSFMEQGLLRFQTAGKVRELLDLPDSVIEGLDPARLLLDAVEPDYSREVCAECRAPPFAFLRLLVGVECAHRRPLSNNPYYSEIDLESATHDRGCSFCPSGAISTKWPYETGPLDLAFGQMSRAVEAVSADPGLMRFYSTDEDRLAFLVQGSEVFHRLEDFLERLLATDHPPSSFLFSCRADELLAKEGVLRSLLPRLEVLGHGIQIWVMGVENFSIPENERFNKGIGPEQILLAQRLMSELETEHPAAFGFSRYGGFSFILFTPWTTIDDLRVNLEWARRVGIDHRGFFLRSRVQLVSGTPIAMLAERDGLVVKEFDEPYFDSGCIQSHHEEELSWRFRRPEVGMIHRIGSRLQPEVRDLACDPLYRRTQGLLGGLEAHGKDRFDAFEALLAVVEERPEEKSEEAVLEVLRKRLGLPERRAEAGVAGRPVEGGAGVEAPLPEGARPGLNPREALGLVRGELEPATRALLAAMDSERLPAFELRGAQERRSQDDKLELRLDLLDGDGAPFTVTIEPSVPGRRYLFAGGRYGVGYAKETPCNSEERMRILGAIAESLRAGPQDPS